MLGLAGDADESGGNVLQRRMHPRHGDFVISIARLNVEPHVLVDFEPERLEQAENALKGVCRGGKAQRLAAGAGGQGRISGSAALPQILEGISAFVFLKHGAPACTRGRGNSGENPPRRYGTAMSFRLLAARQTRSKDNIWTPPTQTRNGFRGLTINPDCDYWSPARFPDSPKPSKRVRNSSKNAEKSSASWCCWSLTRVPGALVAAGGRSTVVSGATSKR